MQGISTVAAKGVWFLEGPYDCADTVRHFQVYTLPYLIGRRADLPLSLSYKTVSTLHAEIDEVGGDLTVRDLGSTNGTYVNGRKISEAVILGEDDLVQFANLPFRVRKQAAEETSCTLANGAAFDKALAMVQFDKLMADRAVTPFYQPIVSLETTCIIAYEVLARSRLFGLESPKEMFGIAEQLSLEVELSSMLRWEGVVSSQSMICQGIGFQGMGCQGIGGSAGGASAYVGPPHLFLNTHPREMLTGNLLASLQSLRANYPKQPLTLEIHESAVTRGDKLSQLRDALGELNIRLAYDDFGVGMSRLNELADTLPDCVKFDMSLIRDIHKAAAQRQQLVATLVQMVHDLGSVALAEGVELEEESVVCKQMGFDLGQGYLYGRPAPPRAK
jgi:EAL domain-containing protein (putative c-di-GMP-specific phosphodiesterase class I)